MSKFIDLTGQKFGEITVIEKDAELTKQKGRVYWKCQCSCGRIKSIRADGLKKIQTCGECKKDLSGQRFGRLIVLKKGKKDKASHQFWICKCDCGNIVEINSDHLRRGKTQSCGCLHSEICHKTLFKDVTGQKFGKLTVLNYEIREGKTYCFCHCDCGNEVWVAKKNLINGHTQSCGCISNSIGEANIQKILQNNAIKICKEYIFKDLPNRRFDFYLPEYNRLIEFDGLQHFKFENTWHKTEAEFKKAQLRDKEKNEYALAYNIPLVRIPYWERDNITLNMILGDQYLIKKEDLQEVAQ